MNCSSLTPHASWTEALRTEVDQFRARNLGRALRSPPPFGCFSHNDYLGLARHPALVEAAARALRDQGVGARAARLLGGHSSLHKALEDDLADFKQTESALVFPSGYMAALGVIPALVGPNDFVLLDRLSHACLFDGARLSGAAVRVFDHNDPDSATSVLQVIRNCSTASTRILLVTESLFSMDGDWAPLHELADLAERFGAWLLVDEAHATGIIGPFGRGALAAAGLGDRVHVQMGTLSKAIGVAGGFIAGNQALIDLLLHRARTFLFTTGTPPALAAAVSAALQILRSKEGDQLRQQLQTNRQIFLRQAPAVVTAADQGSPILPWMVGSSERAVHLGNRLEQLGFQVGVVRPPTVPQEKARLRISFSACHNEREIAGLAAAIHQIIHDES